jgi:hypothetical protein
MPERCPEDERSQMRVAFEFPGNGKILRKSRFRLLWRPTAVL